MISVIRWLPDAPRAAATHYILSGADLIIPAVSGRVDVRYPFTACSRIVLSIDPRCTPKEVERAYRRLRQQRFGSTRRVAPRQAELAAFEHDGVHRS